MVNNCLSDFKMPTRYFVGSLFTSLSKILFIVEQHVLLSALCCFHVMTNVNSRKSYSHSMEGLSRALVTHDLLRSA